MRCVAISRLSRAGIIIQPLGEMLWEGIVRYSAVPQTNESVFAFDTLDTACVA